MVLRAVPRRAAATLLVAVLAALATACGGVGEPPAGPVAFDPPTGFGPVTGSLFGGPRSRVFGRDAEDLPATVVGTSVWTTDGGRMQRVDAEGAATPVPTPPGRYLAGRPRATPGGLVLAGAATVIPGSGTTPPGLAAELVAVEPTAPAVAWTASAPLGWTARPAAVRLRVAGVEAGVAVLSASTDDQRTTVAVDLGTRRVLWSADGVEATAVVSGPDGPVAVGVATPPGESPSYTPSSVVGLDALRGIRRFTTAEGSRSPTVVRAGRSLLAVAGRDTGATSASLAFVGPGGRVVRTVGLGTSYAAPRCVWDEATVTVCATGARVFAVDARSAAPLWSLPDPAANRVAPTVTTAWHGAVYGTTVNGPVVLDGRSGADRDRAPGAAPVLVGRYLAVAPERGGVAGVGGGAAIHRTVR